MTESRRSSLKQAFPLLFLADMPFAGRVVVPSFLPSMATTSNYLASNPGAMQGLVKHPFAEGLDEKLSEVDSSITLPTQTVGDVVSKVISGAVSVDNKEQSKKVFRAIDQMGKIETVLIHARGCTAVKLHPGIGFLSENAGFARLCRANGLNFIGPKASSMDTMGNKSNAINTAMANNVPVVPGSHGILTSAEATAKVADEIGYPVLLKAVHGGGGKGIKVVHSASEVKDAFNTVYAEARSAFGNGDLYLEKFVVSMRHIEVQILRDTHGVTQVLGLRDCTVQRSLFMTLRPTQYILWR